MQTEVERKYDVDADTALPELIGAGTVATALAEEHRAHIDRWFYPCSPEMHRGLGEMYLADERFTRFWDEIEPGLARYVSKAFSAASGS